VPVYLGHDVLLQVVHGSSLLALVQGERLVDGAVKPKLCQDTVVVVRDQRARRVTIVLQIKYYVLSKKLLFLLRLLVNLYFMSELFKSVYSGKQLILTVKYI